jgi:hypothetical protein
MRDRPLRFHYTLVLALRAALGTLRSRPRLERVTSAPISPGQTRSFLVGQKSPLQPSPQSGHGTPKTRAILADSHLIAAAVSVSATAAFVEVVGEITAHELRPATILLNYVAKGLAGKSRNYPASTGIAHRGHEYRGLWCEYPCEETLFNRLGETKCERRHLDRKAILPLHAVKSIKASGQTILCWLRFVACSNVSSGGNRSANLATAFVCDGMETGSGSGQPVARLTEYREDEAKTID